MGRTKATLLSSLIALGGGILCALSFGPLSETFLFGMTFFNLFDYTSSNICLPLGGFICSLFVGWAVNRKFIDSEMSKGNKKYKNFIQVLVFFLRWICPTAIFLIFLNSIGLL